MTDYITIRKEDAEMIRRIMDSAFAEQAMVPKPPSSKPLDGTTHILPAREMAMKGWRHETGFVWSDSSLRNLAEIHPTLARVATNALQFYSFVDFACHDGLRTVKEQQNNVRVGTSRTMESKHLSQSDGKAWAGDFVAFVNGEPNWEWDNYYWIAFAFDCAASALNVANKIRWGGAWDRVLSDFGGKFEAYKKEVDDYKLRHAGPDFIDGPHFEWVA